MILARVFLSLLTLCLIGCASLSSDEPVLKSGLPALQGRWIFSNLDEPNPELETKLSGCRIVVGGSGLAALVTRSGEGMNTVLEVSEETPEMIFLEATNGTGDSWTYDRLGDHLKMPLSSIMPGETALSAHFTRG